MARQEGFEPTTFILALTHVCYKMKFDNNELWTFNEFINKKGFFQLLQQSQKCRVSTMWTLDSLLHIWNDFVNSYSFYVTWLIWHVTYCLSDIFLTFVSNNDHHRETLKCGHCCQVVVVKRLPNRVQFTFLLLVKSLTWASTDNFLKVCICLLEL